MNHPLNTCRQVNAAWGHICGLALGHPGSHIQDLGNTVVAWGFGYTVLDERHSWTNPHQPAPSGAERTTP